MKGKVYIMEKNITIAELVKNLTNLSYDKRIEYIKKNIKSESYIPWATKVSLAKNIVKATSYRLEKTEGDVYKPTNIIEVDSNNRFVLFVTKVIDTWTNIALSENIAGDFDNLNRLGVVDIIMNPQNEIIPAKELNEFNTVIESSFSDLLTNAYEGHAFISNQITRITDVANVILKPLAEKLENMSDKDFAKLVGKLNKVVDKAKSAVK